MIPASAISFAQESSLQTVPTKIITSNTKSSSAAPARKKFL